MSEQGWNRGFWLILFWEHSGSPFLHPFPSIPQALFSIRMESAWLHTHRGQEKNATLRYLLSPPQSQVSCAQESWISPQVLVGKGEKLVWVRQYSPVRDKWQTWMSSQQVQGLKEQWSGHPEWDSYLPANLWFGAAQKILWSNWHMSPKSHLPHIDWANLFVRCSFTYSSIQVLLYARSCPRSWGFGGTEQDGLGSFLLLGNLHVCGDSKQVTAHSWCMSGHTFSMEV
jgi:hypothetical protein